MKVPVRIAALIISLVMIVLGGVAFWTWEENAALPGTGTTRIRIEAGDTLTQTARRLQESGIVRSAALLKALLVIEGSSRSVPQGTFEVTLGMTAFETAKWLQTADPVQVRVTIPEGWTATKIAGLLADKQVVGAPQFLQLVRSQSLEGQLFPDTYLFPLDSSPADVLRKLQKNYLEKVRDLTAGLTVQQVQRGIVMASIIEREYQVATEAPLIASVFWNRLEHGIPLASCATIEYILTEIQGRAHPKRIFFVHTTIPSPFNTYLNKDLPPQPICNPGLTALRAAFQPAKTDFLYFVVSDPAKGSHRFSKSFADHEKARELYLNTYVSKS